MITETEIRALANIQSYSRGEEYYSAGMVHSLVQRGNALFAQVSGSGPLPYQVTANFDGDELVSATCTCPYDWGGYCKHIVATLLAATREPQEIEERRSIDELLADLDADALRGLLRDLLARRSDLVNWLEAQLTVQRSRAQTSSAAGAGSHRVSPKAAVDVKAIRRMVRSAMAASGEYDATSGVVASLDEVLSLARQAIENDDGETALAIIQVIADGVIPGWEDHDDSDGEFGDWFRTLGAVAAEALLTADLAPSEREKWASQLATWQGELDDYGVDDAFGAAMLAASQGWDDPEVRRKLAGNFAASQDWSEDGEEDQDEYGDYDEYEELYADDLIAARLNVLERQGRIEEYLNLARAEGQAVRYAATLVKLGRVEQAVDYGLHNFIAYEEALALANALQGRGEVRAALRIGEHGLALKVGQPAALARWVRAAALEQGESALALQAARAAFEADATLTDYNAVRLLAGDEWPRLKPALLAHL
ncbi:MAG: SWIM zinc finger family protein, partial [Nitrososphaerales archaeon]